MFNQRFLNKYFVNNDLDEQDLIYLQRIKGFQFIVFLVQFCLSQEGQNVFYFDILKHPSNYSPR